MSEGRLNRIQSIKEAMEMIILLDCSTCDGEGRLCCELGSKGLKLSLSSRESTHSCLCLECRDFLDSWSRLAMGNELSPPPGTITGMSVGSWVLSQGQS